MPEEVYWRTRSGKRTKEAASRNLFPQYLFVRFSINDPTWGKVLEADGMRSLLQMDAIPRAIPDAFIERMRSALDLGLFDQTTQHLRMEPGDQLEILDGPFADMVVQFINAPSKKRVEVLMTLMGRETKMSFSVDKVKKV